MKVAYAPLFVRQYKKLPQALQDEIDEKIALFQEKPDHPFLKTHKLQGRLIERLSFSVNYQYRIIFRYLSIKEAVLLCVGDHSIYK